MYMDKKVERGYNEYIRLDKGAGKNAMMDVALLVMEKGIPSLSKKRKKKSPCSCSTVNTPLNGITAHTTLTARTRLIITPRACLCARALK